MDRFTGDGDAAGPRGLRHVPAELLLSLYNSVEYGVVAVDPSGRILTLNAGALSLLNLSVKQALGRQAEDVLRSEQGAALRLLQRVLRRGKPVPCQEVVIEDGLGRLVPLWFSAAPLRNPAGTDQGAVLTLRLAETAVLDEDLDDDEDEGAAFAGIVTGDPHMRKLFRVMPTIARSDSSVLILGETGTGKSLLAKAIHSLSGRRRGPFVTVNCAALPESLLESELFGVRAGAYTGAVKDRPGRLAAANGGTLFVDEIGDVPPAVQVKLLRVLQERVYEPLGEVRPLPCDVRFITATHQDLPALVEDGAFRRDLFFRINVLKVELPPLRDRKGDIPLLVQRFLNRLAQSRGKRVAGVSSKVLEILTHHDYPGNIRELENILEHAWVMCPEDIIEVDHLPEDLRQRRWAFAAPVPADRRPLGRVQAEYIREALERHNGHRCRTARELGMHRTTLIRKMRKLGLEPPEKDGRSLRGSDDPAGDE
ncbi:MAG: sigma-54 interaction domain-containing protein [Candidatus Krumholzibacteriia bacterium]